MHKKSVPLVLLWILLLSLYSQSVSAPIVIPNQGHFIMETIDEPESVDPAWAIDTASRALIFNVYDTLVFFDQEKVDEFLPYLATDWWVDQPPHPDAPPGTDSTWYFRIRGTSGTHTMESVLGQVPAGYPISTSWHETYPWYSKLWHIEEWIDNPFNPDAILSPSDIIKMTRACQNWPAEVTQTFHVDEVTITIIMFTWKPIIQWTWKPPYEGSGTAELVEDVEPFGPSIGDTYHQLEPPEDFCRLFNITSHEDANLNGVIDASEQFDVEYHDEPGVKRDAHMDVVPYSGSVVAEPVEDIGSFGPSIGDTYHQLSPSFSRLFSITSHEDTDGNGVINPSEQFDIEYLDEPGVTRDAHLDEIYISNIVVTEIPVPFQDGSYLTTEDVEYSFERLMVMDRTGGPSWKIYEPLLGVYHADMDWPQDPFCPINLAVESNSTHVWFNLVMPYPPFMQILCGSWASIVNEEFCVAHGCWPSHDWAHWQDYHDPEISPLDAAGNVLCGTGPYMLDYWTHGVEWSIVRFVDHWQQWPAPHCSRYLDRVTNRVVYEFGIRYVDFIACVADEVYIPTPFLPVMIENWPTEWDEERMLRVDEWGNPEHYAAGIECLPGLPTLTIDAAMFFTFDINPASPYVGTGSLPGGIPLNFFNDTRIRKAFAYCFNYTEFIEDMYWNEAVQPTSCVKQGILYHNPDNPTYYYDSYEAAELFQEANDDPTSPAYQVWNLGFTMTITYNTGNVPRETAAEMFAENVGDLFELGPDGIPGTGDEAPGTADVTVLGLPSPTFEEELVGYPLFQSLMPLFITSWLNEYPDPHDDVHPFMHTYGHFSRFQSYSNATVDALIEEGIATPNGPPRQAIYETLQLMYFEECPSVGLAQPLKRHWEKDWVQGWYYNPLYPGQKYFKNMWKGLNGDINGDNVVDMLDLGMVSAHWYPGPPVGPLGYDKIADIYPELQYIDIPKVWDPVEGWIPNPSIGAVDMFDAALVSYHWLEAVDP